MIRYLSNSTLLPLIGSFLCTMLAVAGCREGDSQTGPGTMGRDGGASADLSTSMQDGASSGDGTAERSDTTRSDRDTGSSPRDDAGETSSKASCLRDRFEAARPTSCQSPSAETPPRCRADLRTFSKWGPISVISKLQLLSDKARNDTFDLNREEGVDNNMANLLDSFSLVDINVDARLEQNISRGNLIFALEHQGVTSVPLQRRPYPINPIQVTFQTSTRKRITSPGTPYLAQPESFAQGAFPEARLESATIRNNVISTEPGNLALRLQLDIFEVSVPVRGATLRADISASGVLAGRGISLTNGRIGGYVLVRDLFDILNDMYRECSCLDNPATTFDIPEVSAGEPDLCPKQSLAACDVPCRDAVTSRTSQCTPEADGAFCNGVDLICTLKSTVTNQADLDTDCDGVEDAISLGAVFEATGGRIRGTAESISASTQTIPRGRDATVTLESVLLQKRRWIVLRETGPEGRVVGRTSMPRPPGQYSDVEITLEAEVSDNQTLRAVLHRDTGESGTFEFDPTTSGTPDQPVRNARGEMIDAEWVVKLP